MSYQPVFKGWKLLTLSDLVVAYRKAKADCFFENAFPTAINFAQYEQNLIKNLEGLLHRLKENEGITSQADLLGTCRFVPKKLVLTPRDSNVQSGHAHISNTKKSFEYICRVKNLNPEFRVVGDFPVDTHVISALWINMVGHKFDACLNDKDIYGARLKRVRSDDLNSSGPKAFHITAVGSFEPYFQPYKKWRNDGFSAIRTEIDQGRSVVAASLDLRSYYHLIDSGFISEPNFQKEIGLTDEKALTKEEKLFTKQLATLLNDWSDKAKKFSSQFQNSNSKSDEINGGLTIGLTASRIFSNVLLHKWDKLVREKLTPVHYGRYVDDMFLVILDGGAITDTPSFIAFLKERLPEVVKDAESNTINRDANGGVPLQIDLGKGYQKNSMIQLQPSKQKLFLLAGNAGLDLIDSIEQEITKLSSERRLMPTPDQLERTTAAKVLAAGDDISENADTLRRADGLTIHRLSWSLQLRHVETLAHDLPPAEWKKQRNDFFEFAHNHVLRPDKIFAHYQHLPRLLSFSITSREWSEAERIISSSLEALKILAEKCDSHAAINGKENCSVKPEIWEQLQASLVLSFIDAAASSYPKSLLFEEKPHPRVKRVAEMLVSLLLGKMPVFDDAFWQAFSYGNFLEVAPLIAISDLAKEPYKLLHQKNDSILLKSESAIKQQLDIWKEFQQTELLTIDVIFDFLISTRNIRLNSTHGDESSNELITPFLFPTRPFTPEEISELAPQCVGKFENANESDKSPASIWAAYVRALRGTWVNPVLLEDGQYKGNIDQKPCYKIGNISNKRIYVAITNFATEEDSWGKTASGKSDLTLERYKRLCDIVNQSITTKPKPDYVLLPELSLPLEWVDSIANRLRSSGINLIAGTEYRHVSPKALFSEVCLVLTDDRLGYPATVRIWQPKLEPSVGEDKELTSKIGKAVACFSKKYATKANL